MVLDREPYEEGRLLSAKRQTYHTRRSKASMVQYGKPSKVNRAAQGISGVVFARAGWTKLAKVSPDQLGPSSFARL